MVTRAHRSARSKATRPCRTTLAGAISLAANALCHADGKAVLKYVETKAAVGGVTAIQGSAKLAHTFEGFMVRNVEFETFRGQLKKSVNQSVLPFESAAQYAAAKQD